MIDSHCYFFKFKEKTAGLWKLLVSLPFWLLCQPLQNQVRTLCKDSPSLAISSAYTFK